ncbi:MAG: hypothetical protein RI544_08160 [Haloquadratum sp.]|nr:hypothetical protein [Haloquadratum sp.]
MGTETIAASVPDDSHLWMRFEEYRRSRALASKSEAARELIKSGLETELDYNGGRTLIDGNESLLVALAFIISAQGLVDVTVTVFGAVLGPIVFAFVGTLILTWLALDYQPRIIWRHINRWRRTA